VKAQAQAISELKSAFRPDVVHVHLYGISPLLDCMTRRAWPAPTIATLHTALGAVARSGGALLRILAESDVAVALSHAMRAEILELEPALAGRVCVVPNGVQAMGTPTELPSAPAALLCLGRLIPEKGFDLALRAAQRLARRGTPLRVLVAGDGPERPALESLATELGIAPITRFLGFVDPARVPDVLSQATVVIVPSRWEEPSACVVREAASMARPVVASRVGGTPELIEDDETGLLFERDDVDGLTAALAALLGDPERARRLGEAARDRVLATCSLDGFVTAYEALYRRVVDGARPAVAS
jgi:glycogen(starch) synthase